MIPLMMQQGYKAKGWLGLILGTALYFPFHAEAVATDEMFMQQMDALTREIGDRGKVKTKPTAEVSEGVPPAPAPTPTPAPAPAPAPTPASTSTSAPAPPPSSAAVLAPVPAVPQLREADSLSAINEVGVGSTIRLLRHLIL